MESQDRGPNIPGAANGFWRADPVTFGLLPSSVIYSICFTDWFFLPSFTRHKDERVGSLFHPRPLNLHIPLLFKLPFHLPPLSREWIQWVNVTSRPIRHQLQWLQYFKQHDCDIMIIIYHFHSSWFRLFGYTWECTGPELHLPSLVFSHTLPHSITGETLFLSRTLRLILFQSSAGHAVQSCNIPRKWWKIFKHRLHAVVANYVHIAFSCVICGLIMGEGDRISFPLKKKNLYGPQARRMCSHWPPLLVVYANGKDHWSVVELLYDKACIVYLAKKKKKQDSHCILMK